MNTHMLFFLILKNNFSDEIAAVGVRLSEMIPFCSNARNKCFKRTDVLAMSYLILAVKLVFGLNDSLEWYVYVLLVN